MPALYPRTWLAAISSFEIYYGAAGTVAGAAFLFLTIQAPNRHNSKTAKIAPYSNGFLTSDFTNQ